MNKKIFTLLVGACLLISSLFTVNAQRTFPYSFKQKADTTNFYDRLTADTVKRLPSTEGHFYLLGVTGLANAASDSHSGIFNDDVRKPNTSYVVYVDSVQGEKDTAYLRIENLATLDTTYGFKYNGSYKFGAIRQASWCLSYTRLNNTAGSNILYDFTNMHIGKTLTAPEYRTTPEADWSVAADGNKIYKGKAAINAKAGFQVNGWHFSQTYLPSQDLQTGMPLYSYLDKDRVAVLVLAPDTFQTSAGTTDPLSGGYCVTVKIVAVDDLLDDTPARNVKTGVPGCVENVLLFTLQKINKFVMNADDWNAINNADSTILFDENADVEINNGGAKYTNPFMDQKLKAYEVNDSLYHYGYMQFRKASTKDNFLYVDTAFVNTGNTNYLAFNWSKKRNGNGISTFPASVNSATLAISDTLFWGNSFKSISDATFDGKIPDPGKYHGPDSAATYHTDSLNYLIAYMKDSLMENQSKFRVVYDPFVDSTFINVYQSRVRYQDLQSGEWPNWWVNSFSQRNGKLEIPSDFISYSAAISTMQEKARYYYDRVIKRILISPEGMRYSDDTIFYINRFYEGHGDPIHNMPSEQYNFHSEMQFYPQSSPSNMDKVMISTADTVVIYDEFYNYKDSAALAHMYGWSLTRNGERKYKDSLLYVDLQDIGGSGNNHRIITLDQSYKNGFKALDTKISLDFGSKCDPQNFPAPPEPSTPEPPETVDNLYLIRNEVGEFLCVPLWSISDSVYWVTPEKGEDPTQMPSYQWIVCSGVDNKLIITNREFENVEYLVTTSQNTLNFGIERLQKKKTYSKFLEGDSIGFKQFDPNKFVAEFNATFNLRDSVCLFPLAEDVKNNPLLGYRYVDRDSAFIDVYALKYYNTLAMGDDARYLSWNGYKEGSEDQTVWATAKDQFDKLYFELQEMTAENMSQAPTTGNSPQGKYTLTGTETNPFLKDLYTKLTSKEEVYMNTDSIILERYGFYEPNRIANLSPLVRQAYRLFLKDYYYWYPIVKGHYMIPGESDRYILADKAYANAKYVPGEGRIEGLFGIPHFYFRNTYFDVEGVCDNYFAMIQRLDTLRIDELGNQFVSYADVDDYLTYTFGSNVAQKIKAKVIRNGELDLFVVQVNDATGKVEYSVRGESAKAISTYQLTPDRDPIYRRLHVNEPIENLDPVNPNRPDDPDTLEFHIMNQPRGLRLYENSGHYTAEKAEPVADRRGPCGGRIYNVTDNGYYKRDTLNKVISFLGINPLVQYQNENYAFYVDTAYINRGTGWIKPQYMLVVDPFFPEEIGGCDPKTPGDTIEPSPNRPYLIGRYLYNASMNAKAVADSLQTSTGAWEKVNMKNGDDKYITYTNFNYNKVQPINVNDKKKYNGESYKYKNDWERLAFAWAIHHGDSLYVLKGVEPLYAEESANDADSLWEKLVKEYPADTLYRDGAKYLNFDDLIKKNVKGSIYEEPYYKKGDIGGVESREYNNYKSMDEVRDEGRTIGLHAVIALDDNTHKDWVFSFRYIERGANEFVIESETRDRNTRYGQMIRPGYGGWIKSDNGVPVITRSDTRKMMGEAAIFGVNRPDPVAREGHTDPVANEDFSEFAVIGGTGSVTILNAANKNVVITNVLGQTVARRTVTSNNATIQAPAGVVVVAVQGEVATKVLVK